MSKRNGVNEEGLIVDYDNVSAPFSNYLFLLFASLHRRVIGPMFENKNIKSSSFMFKIVASTNVKQFLVTVHFRLRMKSVRRTYSV